MFFVYLTQFFKSIIMRTPTLQYLYLQKPVTMIVIICIISVLPWLGLSDISMPDNSETAQISSAMLESGNWIAPILSGKYVSYDHPMLYWLVSLCSLWQGYVSHLTVLLPGAVAYIAIITSTLIFFGRRTKFHEAFIGSLFLITCVGMQNIYFVNSGDLLFATFIIISLTQLYRWEETIELKGLPVGISALLSAAVLTKGLMGLILPLLAFGIYLFMLNKYDKLTIFKTLFYMGVSALFIPALWYIAIWKQGGFELLQSVMSLEFDYFWKGSNYNIFYTFLLLAVGFMPWVVFFVFSLFGAQYKKPSMPKNNVKFFSFIVLVSLFVVYAIMPVKKSSFLLPIYPFITIFLAEYALFVTEYRTLCTRIFAAFLATVVLLGLMVPFFPKSWGINLVIDFTPRITLVAGFTCVMLAAVYYQMLKRINIKILYATIALTFAVNMLLNVLMGSSFLSGFVG